MISLSDLTQKDWLNACRKLGLEVDTSKGKGSHARISKPNTNFRPQTVPYHTHKFISLAIYKSLLEWGFDETEIDKALK